MIREVRDFGPRQDIIREGDKPDDVHLILDGWAVRYKVLRNGNRPILAYLIPGDLCDVRVTLLGEMDHSIGTLSPCTVGLITRSEISTLMREHELLSRALWWSTLLGEAILREWLVSVGHRPVDKRLAHFICEMLLRSKAIGLAHDDGLDLPLTQEELGDTMGMFTVHVNRMFQRLRGLGLITTTGKRMTANDLNRLMGFAEFNPNYLHQLGQVRSTNEAGRQEGKPSHGQASGCAD